MKAQRGYSMIELLVAITLSILVTDAAVSLFLANKNTSSTTTAIAAVSDSGRYALNFIEQSVRTGGYMACNGINNLNQPPPTGGVQDFKQISVLPAGATPVQNSYQFAFGGYEAAATGQGSVVALSAMPVLADTTPGDWLLAGGGGLDALLTANTPAVPGVIKGTDVIVVRESLPQSRNMFTTALYTAGALNISVNNTASIAGITLPHAAVISNCGASAAFQLTGLLAGAPGTLNMGAGVPITFGNPVQVAPVVTQIYYIGRGRDTDGALYLWQDDAPGGSVELVPDVESMQVLYGVVPPPANPNVEPGVATAYVTADQVPDFNRVVSIKVALLVSSPPGTIAVRAPTAAPTYALLGTTVTAPIDARFRKVFDVTIAARNAAQ